MSVGQLKTITTIVCEDIREETAGSKSLIGVHGGYYNVSNECEGFDLSILTEAQASSIGKVEGEHRLRWKANGKLAEGFTRHFSIDLDDLETIIAFTFQGSVDVDAEGELLFEIKQNEEDWETLRTIWVSIRNETDE